MPALTASFPPSCFLPTKRIIDSITNIRADRLIDRHADGGSNGQLQHQGVANDPGTYRHREGRSPILSHPLYSIPSVISNLIRYMLFHPLNSKFLVMLHPINPV